jgi:hypothetical protein
MTWMENKGIYGTDNDLERIFVAANMFLDDVADVEKNKEDVSPSDGVRHSSNVSDDEDS